MNVLNFKFNNRWFIINSKKMVTVLKYYLNLNKPQYFIKIYYKAMIRQLQLLYNNQATWSGHFQATWSGHFQAIRSEPDQAITLIRNPDQTFSGKLILVRHSGAVWIAFSQILLFYLYDYTLYQSIQFILDINTQILFYLTLMHFFWCICYFRLIFIKKKFNFSFIV